MLYRSDTTIRKSQR